MRRGGARGGEAEGEPEIGLRKTGRKGRRCHFPATAVAAAAVRILCQANSAACRLVKRNRLARSFANTTISASPRSRPGPPMIRKSQ